MKRILHVLGWRLEDVTKALTDIQHAGFNAIQISPVQAFREDGYDWWKMYQPLNIEIGNRLGSRESLVALCKSAHDLSIEVYVDVCLRNVASAVDDPLVPHPNVDPTIDLADAEDCLDYEDRYEATHKRVGLPMVDYFSERMQHYHRAFLHDIVACGVDGFRVDMAKHFALPSEGCDYLTYVYGDFADKFIYGEVLFAPTALLDDYSEHMHVLTNGRLTDPTKAVYFVESHDSYHDDLIGWSREWKDEEILHRYRWLLEEQPKANTLFFARPFNDTWKRAHS